MINVYHEHDPTDIDDQCTHKHMYRHVFTIKLFIITSIHIDVCSMQMHIDTIKCDRTILIKLVK